MKKPLGKTFKVHWACGGDVNNRNTDDSLRLIAETIKLPSKYICPIGLVDTYRGFSLRPLKQQIPLQSAIISRITKGLEKHRSDYLPTKTEFEITLKKANLPRYRGGLRKRLTNWPATTLDIPERMNQATLARVTAIQTAAQLSAPTVSTKLAIAHFHEGVQGVYQRLGNESGDRDRNPHYTRSTVNASTKSQEQV